MKRVMVFLALIGIAWLITGCGEREYVAKTFDENFCDTLGDVKFIQVSGVLKAPDTVIDEGDRLLVLIVTDIYKTQPWIQVRIKKGNGNNEIAPLPDQFTFADFKVKTDDGRILSHGDPITIYGQALGCTSLSADKIN